MRKDRVIRVNLTSQDSRVTRIWKFIPTKFWVIGLAPVLLVFWERFRITPEFRYLFGDDYMTIRRLTMSNNLNSLSDSFFAAGLGKWRPLNMVLLDLTARRWEFNPLPYLQFNAFLLLILAFTVAFFCLRLFDSALLGALSGAVVLFSRFSWYSQFTLYGQMELPALIFFIIGIFTACFAVQGKKNAPLLLLPMFGCFLISSMFHERYVIPGVATLLILIFLGMHQHKNAISFYAFLITAMHLIMKIYVIGVDPLTGGGESSLRGLAPSVFLNNFLSSLKMLIGYYSGLTTFNSFEEGEFVVKATGLKTGALVLIIPLVAIIFFLRKLSRDSWNVQSKKQIVIFSTAGVFLLIPAASVSSRIEGRWLYGSFLCLVFVVLVFVKELSSSAKSRFSKFMLIFAAGFFIAIPDVYYRKDLGEFGAVQTQTDNIFQLAQSESPPSGPWAISIVIRDKTMPIHWQLGYGAGFSQLINPPLTTTIGTSDMPCPSIKVTYPCVKISIEGLYQPLLSERLIIPAKIQKINIP